MDDLLSVARQIVTLPPRRQLQFLEGLEPAELEKFRPAMAAAFAEVENKGRRREGPAEFAERLLGFTNAPIHREWYDLSQKHHRLAIVAPRDHGKSECLTVVNAAWRIATQETTWVYVFAATGDLAKVLKARIDEVVALADPSLVPTGAGRSKQETYYRNGSRITARGAGAAVRGAHPDVIIGDDVLEESRCLTAYQRDKTARWWHGTVGGMAHPGTTRTKPNGERVKVGATRVLLVGTPFHRSDLLMSMRDNPLYHFRRYAAEYNSDELANRTADSLAVEIN